MARAHHSSHLASERCKSNMVKEAVASFAHYCDIIVHSNKSFAISMNHKNNGPRSAAISPCNAGRMLAKALLSEVNIIRVYGIEAMVMNALGRPYIFPLRSLGSE